MVRSVENDAFGPQVVSRYSCKGLQQSTGIGAVDPSKGAAVS